MVQIGMTGKNIGISDVNRFFSCVKILLVTEFDGRQEGLEHFAKAVKPPLPL